MCTEWMESCPQIRHRFKRSRLTIGRRCRLEDTHDRTFTETLKIHNFWMDRQILLKFSQFVHFIFLHVWENIKCRVLFFSKSLNLKKKNKNKTITQITLNYSHSAHLLGKLNVELLVHVVLSYTLFNLNTSPMNLLVWTVEEAQSHQSGSLKSYKRKR